MGFVWKLIATFTLTLSLAVGATAADKIVMSSFPIPLMVEDAENGVFIELAKEVAKRAGLDITIKVAPPKRVVGAFVEGKIDCFFPALDVSFPENHPKAKSENIYVKRDFVFTKKGAPLLKTFSEISGNKIGLTQGYPYDAKVMAGDGFSLDIAPNDELNAKKLVAGRIDGFIVEEKTGIQAFKNSGLSEQFQYDTNSPISEQDVYFAFQSSDAGKKMAANVSEALSSMKADGTFGKIMSKAK